jgi:hypothetical protein
MKHTLAISTTAAIAAAGLYLRRIQNQISRIPAHDVACVLTTPTSFRRSKAISLVNNENYFEVHDTHSLTLTLPHNLSDEEVLARFVKGFFGGHVFEAERSILRMVGREMTSLGRKYITNHLRSRLSSHFRSTSLPSTRLERHPGVPTDMVTSRIKCTRPTTSAHLNVWNMAYD